MQKESSEAKSQAGWEAHAVEQIEYQLGLSVLQRLQALEELILFAHKYAGIAKEQEAD